MYFDNDTIDGKGRDGDSDSNSNCNGDGNDATAAADGNDVNEDNGGNLRMAIGQWLLDNDNGKITM